MQIRPRLRGRWGSGSTVTVEEVDEIWVYCTAAEFKKNKAALVLLAESIAHDADQEAIAILVDAGMEIVVEEKP